MTSVCNCDSCIANGVALPPAPLRRAAAPPTRPAAPSARRSAIPNDPAYTLRLSEAFLAIREAHPELAPYECIQWAQKVVAGGALEHDVDRAVLHGMAVRYANEHNVPYRDALLAVSAEYDRMVRRPRDPADVPGRSLDARAAMYMREHPNASYRTALLEVSRIDAAENAQTVKSKPYPAPGSGAAIDVKSQPKRATVEQIAAYAKQHGVTYAKAKIELERILNGMDPAGGQD